MSAAEEFELAGRTRIWGLPVMRLFYRAGQQALTAAPAAPPAVNLTVIHVQAGAVLSVGGVGVGPSVVQAILQRDAITTTTEGNHRDG